MTTSKIEQVREQLALAQAFTKTDSAAERHINNALALLSEPEEPEHCEKCSGGRLSQTCFCKCHFTEPVSGRPEEPAEQGAELPWCGYQVHTGGICGKKRDASAHISLSGDDPLHPFTPLRLPSAAEPPKASGEELVLRRIHRRGPWRQSELTAQGVTVHANNIDGIDEYARAVITHKLVQRPAEWEWRAVGRAEGPGEGE